MALGTKRGLAVFGFFKKRQAERQLTPDEEEFKNRQGKNASVLALPQGLVIESESGRGLLRADREAFHCFLPPDANDDTLGNAVISALAASRFLSREEADKFLDISTAANDVDEWASAMFVATGIKNKQQLFRKMARCGVTARNRNIEFSPTIKGRGAGWEGRGPKFDSIISQDARAQAIGAALREALSKCLPNVIRLAQQSAPVDRRDDAAPTER